MHDSYVLTLQRHREYPSVSILVSTEPGGRLAEADRARITARIDDLTRRLHGDVDTECAVDLVERLRALAAEAASSPARAALALFASPSRTALFHLDVDVRERTVVDDTFATRDLVEQVRRDTGYVVVTVSDRRVRAFDGTASGLAPTARTGFPVVRPAEESDRVWGLRTLDAVRRLGDPAAPLILMGAERRVTAVSRAAGVRAAAVVRGNHDATPPASLAELARPHVDAWHRARNDRALARLDVARGRHLLATGLDEVWWLAQEGRVELLVVERSHAVPVRIDPGRHLVPVPPEELEAPDVVDDAIDDLIEAVALRRGEVVVVPDATLAGTGGLAAVLRY